MDIKLSPLTAEQVAAGQLHTWERWNAEVSSVDPRRVLALGADPARYAILCDGVPTCVPVYQHPDTRHWVAVLPEDVGEVQITYWPNTVPASGW